MYYKQKIQKLKQNSKALSPVVASIILIAVTVAVSIAVAAWMGQLAGGFMETEQVQVDTQTFTVAAGESAGSISVTVRNTGTSAVIISTAKINGVTASIAGQTLEANAAQTFTITPTGDITIVAGNNYQVEVITSKNNAFSTSAIAVA